jgi:cyclophilin family peptidyl-prolyl cis-trans isomerase
VKARFETSMGDFTAELNEKEAPITSKNFADLAEKGYYNNLTFHRVIDNFMIQGGCPQGTGTGGPGYTIQDEHNTLKHDKAGVLAMARTSAPNSAGSQFYITVVPTPFLDGQKPPYVVFGQVTDGVDVVQKIGKTQTDSRDKPVTPVVIKTITIEK